PDSVCHVEYAPLGRLLPNTAALVHHGGIGTAAQALRAGVPQVVLPRRHDQCDNARRLRRLGVARILRAGRPRAGRMARALERLLTSTEVKACCEAAAGRLAGVDALEESCRVIEETFPRAGTA